MRLLSVTPDVALDRTLTVRGWRKAAIARTDQVLESAGGKGVNVARAAGTLGLAATIVGVLAGRTGEHIRTLAEAEDLDTRWVWLGQGQSRVCTILVDPDDPPATIICEAGPTLAENDWRQMVTRVRDEAAQSDVTTICGPLPAGIGASALGALLDTLMADGRALAVDSSGEALVEAIRRPIWLVKATHEALGEVLGKTLSTPESAVAAARPIVANGPRTLIITLGAQGTVCVRRDGAWWARPPEIRALSAVGSGDSLLAGVIASRLRGEQWPDPLRLGVACWAADTLTIGAGRLNPDDVTSLRSQVKLEEMEAHPTSIS